MGLPGWGGASLVRQWLSMTKGGSREQVQLWVLSPGADMGA
jgi:hypothetical protein